MFIHILCDPPGQANSTGLRWHSRFSPVHSVHQNGSNETDSSAEQVLRLVFLTPAYVVQVSICCLNVKRLDLLEVLPDDNQLKITFFFLVEPQYTGSGV